MGVIIRRILTSCFVYLLTFAHPSGVVSSAVLGPSVSRLSAAATRGAAAFSEAAAGCVATSVRWTAAVVSVMAPLAVPIVSFLFERGSFGPNDSAVVGCCFLFYMLGKILCDLYPRLSSCIVIESRKIL